MSRVLYGPPDPVRMMPGTRRVEHPRRDPRIALYSQGVDPPQGDPSAWSGEAKLSGRGVKLAGRTSAGVRSRARPPRAALTSMGVRWPIVDPEAMRDFGLAPLR